MNYECVVRTVAVLAEALQTADAAVVSLRVRLVLRLVIGLLVVAAIGVATVPLLIVLDIRDGGDGWGLCADGLSGCRTSYFAGFEFVAMMFVGLFAILGLIAGCVRLLRWLEARSSRRELDAGYRA